FRLVDEYLRIEVILRPDPPAAVWTFPIWTVSSSEGGIERIFQGATVVLSWPLDVPAASFALDKHLRSDT
ncbi:MAG: alpha-amylase/4-alpha-glucanotransferase domain-containing protein, partial [Planctomycetota bacterium]